MWIFLFCFAVTPSLICAAETTESDSLERREKVQLKSFFLKSVGSAQMPTTPMSVELYNQAVDYFQANEYALARQALEKSLDLDDANAFSYELMGDLDNNQQDLDSAREHYQIAYNLNPVDRIRKKLEKLGKEKAVDKKLSTYAEEHFIIKYQKDENRPVEGFELRELLRTTYRNLSKDFAYYFKHKVVVLLYDEADFKQVTEAPHWVTGLYDGKVRMPINKKGFSDQDLKSLTAHEVSHAFVAAMSSGKAPAWINEGLAVYEQNKIKSRGMRLFNKYARQGKLFSLDELTAGSGPMSLKDQDRINLFYSQSFHLVRYLIHRYKMFRVKEMLQAYGNGKNSEEVIREVLKLSMARLEREWLETV
ncbi:peptidase MA family metallohydrolase [Omnitrophica bacterium]|nr:peptidase MA family metallohydrolase [Candidatus Omnitrophota bacterium]